MRSKRLLIMATIAVLTATALMHLHPGGARAFTLEPYYKEFILEQGDTVDDAFIFTNTSQEPATFVLSVNGYDPREEKNVDTKVLVSPEQETVTLAPGEEKLIPFTINLTPDVQNGSYFNIIYLEQVSDTPEGENNVGINLGFGMIVAIHVVEPGGTVNNSFRNQTRAFTEVISNGIPYLRPSQFKYTFENNSSYIFRPLGEIRIFNAQTDELLHTEQINLDEKLIYGGEDLVQEFEVDLWTYKNLKEGFKIVTRTYNNLDNGYIDTETEIPGFSNIIYVIIALVALVLLYIIIKVLGSIFGGRKSKKAPTPSESKNSKKESSKSSKSKKNAPKSDSKSEN